ncbi:MAG: DeoR/GlpR family DNA-binding transcription regulator [Alphaproteobacteria bacterium]|nr:DeoR/GlpR family DNA-binding transcription regulator [Alphaproteobacteria bacterium]
MKPAAAGAPAHPNPNSQAWTMRNPLTRRQNIREALKRDGALSIEELCQIVDASPATLRRDLSQLEKEGSIERSRGGAAPRRQHPAEVAIAQRVQQYAEEKAAIARLAMQLINPGDTVLMSDGSSNLALARLLVQSNIEVFVATSGLNVAIALSEGENVQVCVVGGMLRAMSLATDGEFALRTLDYLNADIAFVSGDSFGLEQGLNFLYPGDATMAAAILARARRKVALTISAKTDWKARVKSTDIETLDIVVAEHATPRLVADCEAAGIRLLTPETNMNPMPDDVASTATR